MEREQDAELAVIGAAFIDPASVDRVADIVSPESFGDARCRAVWRVLEGLHSQGAPIDRVSVCRALAARGQLPELVDEDLVDAMASCAATALNVQHHARAVAGYAAQRRVARLPDVVRRASAEAMAGVDDPSRAAEAARAAVLDAVLRAVGRPAVEGGSYQRMTDSLAQMVQEAREAYEARARGEDTAGIMPIGLASVARLVDMGRRELHVIGGHTGAGKTALLVRLMRDAMRWVQGTDDTVFYYSCEVPGAKLGARLVCGTAGIRARALRRGEIDSGEIERMLAAVKSLRGAGTDQMWTWWKPHATAEDIVSRVRLHDRTQGFARVVVIDHFGQLRAARRGHSEGAEAASVVQHIDMLKADGEGRLVIVAGQYVRGGQAIKWGAELEKIAHGIYHWERPGFGLPDDGDPASAQLRVQKGRETGTGVARLTFDGETQRIESADDDAAWR